MLRSFLSARKKVLADFLIHLTEICMNIYFTIEEDGLRCGELKSVNEIQVVEQKQGFFCHSNVCFRYKAAIENNCSIISAV